MKTVELKKSIRSGPYTWPGGYPLYSFTTDGGVLCFDCLRSEYRQIYPSVRDHLNDGWTVEGFEIHWEGASLSCDHCGKEIESAYGDPNAVEGCLTCEQVAKEGFGPSHDGSPRCESGSIASGGKRSHCTCDTCF